MNIPHNSRKPLYITDIGILALPRITAKGVPDRPLIQVRNTWLRIEEGKITRLGPEGENVPADAKDKTGFSAEGRFVTPGLVDCHTHPAFAGTRQGEFVRRCRGESYQQIAAAGGGILSSINGVRAATEKELAASIRRRLDRFIELGVTSIEAKSGYGLSMPDELKSLRALKTASDQHPIEISPTLLGAHVVPPEFKENPDGYVDIVCDQMIPRVAEENLADAVDVFLEEGAFNLAQARRIFEAGKAVGLMLRIHADQFSSGGGAELAAEFGAASADHMDRTDDEGYRLLADAGVTVVLLPGAVFFLGMDRYAPARRMIDNGCRIALSTDFNPGSTPTQSLPLMMTLACIKMELSPQEALWSTTIGGAFAVRRDKEIGSLMPGYNADLCVWNAEDIDFLPYSYGDMIPTAVFKKGELVAENGCRLSAEGV